MLALYVCTQCDNQSNYRADILGGHTQFMIIICMHTSVLQMYTEIETKGLCVPWPAILVHLCRPPSVWLWMMTWTYGTCPCPPVVDSRWPEGRVGHSHSSSTHEQLDSCKSPHTQLPTKGKEILSGSHIRYSSLSVQYVWLRINLTAFVIAWLW